MVPDPTQSNPIAHLRILMIAPQAVFFHRAHPVQRSPSHQGLCRCLGHQIRPGDLRLWEKIFRSRTWSHLSQCKTAGRSSKSKLGLRKPSFFSTLDFAGAAEKCSSKGKYDLLHTHEEASLLGSQSFPPVQDSPSSTTCIRLLPQQLDNFRFTARSCSNRSFARLEKSARDHEYQYAMITICPVIAALRQGATIHKSERDDRE